MINLNYLSTTKPKSAIRFIRPMYWLKIYRIYSLKISLRFERWRIGRRLNKLQGKNLIHGPSLLSHRQKKLNNILEYANKHCSYYSRTFAEINWNKKNPDTFRSIPILSKSIIRENYKDIISNEIELLDHHKSNTGGSTGEPLEFMVSGNLDDLHQKYQFELMGYISTDIIFGLGGIEIPENLREKNIFWISTGSELPYGSTLFSSLYLNDRTIPFYIDHIIDNKPSFLRGYPSFLNEVAIYVIQKKIKINFIKGVQLTSEIILENQITNIKDAFNCEVHFQYGHSEASVFAYTDGDNHKYYCSPYYGLVEVITKQGRHANIGESGEIIVTGFYNKAMPFIRYKTGDIGTYGGEKNGVVTLTKIEGRTQDYVFTKTGNKVALTALVFGLHFSAFKNIIKWQLIQNDPGAIQLHIVRSDNYSEKDEKEIIKKMSMLKIEFHYCNQIPYSERGKYKFLVQNVTASG